LEQWQYDVTTAEDERARPVESVEKRDSMMVISTRDDLWSEEEHSK
jgi:hypothetical protein